MIIEFRVMSKFFEFLKDLESQEELELVDNNIDDTKRFNSDNVNYFDSFYESKFIDTILIIKHINKSIFFRNSHIFINRVKNVARVKDNILLK